MFCTDSAPAEKANKLAEVKAEMLKMGAPVIRVVDCGDYYMALDGSHRLAAAAELDITPEFIVFEQGEMIDISKEDWYEAGNWAETELRWRGCGRTAEDTYIIQIGW